MNGSPAMVERTIAPRISKDEAAAAKKEEVEEEEGALRARPRPARRRAA
ncbi:hypothetical protein [Sorangium sp. So ce363]